MEIGPLLFTAMGSQLTGGVETSWLSFTHDCCHSLAFEIREVGGGAEGGAADGDVLLN